MSIKQDRNGVRTAQDIERKYDLASLVGLKKAVENNTIGLNETNTELEEFMTETIGDLETLQTDVDGKITTYYYSGVPSLLNLPASEWDVNDYSKHIGDLYYDQETGHAYRFQIDNSVYSWLQIVDEDIATSLATANAAKDTADNKRRVFVAEPIPPYDYGDLWFNDGEIFICQISKLIGSYEADDFVLATDYTDDTIAKQVGEELTILQGTVTTVRESQDEFRIDLDTVTQTVDNNKNAIDETINTMSYSFGTNDLVIASSSDPVNARINNQGLKVYTYNDLNSIFNHNGTGIQKLIVVGDSQLANIRIAKAVDENGKDCTDIHHLISNIQSLSDLED